MEKQHVNARAPEWSSLAAVFRRYPQVWAVYLFGSWAEGRPHRESDVDLGVVLRPNAAAPDKLDLLADLARAGWERVDLVFLDPFHIKDIVLWFEVVRHNRLLYAAPDYDHGSVFSRIVRLYWDFEPLLRVHRQAYKERVLGGETGSHPQTPAKAG